MGKTKAKRQGPGRALIRNKNKKQIKERSNRHSQDPEPEKGRLDSIIEQNDLNEFIQYAQLSNRDFTAQKEQVTIVDTDGLPKTFKIIDGENSLEEQKPIDAEELNKLQQQFGIPRRPKWSRTMTKEELHKLENNAFLEWRRNLAKIEENNEGIVVTPYEKNLNVWRELWRVIERSAIVCQIVDARNPAVFRCKDLESYVKEIDPHKINVLILNKADLLTQRQRFKWAQYFKNEGVNAIFFSAAKEQLKINAEEEGFKPTYDPEHFVNPGDKDWTYVYSRVDLLNYFHHLIKVVLPKLKKQYPKEDSTENPKLSDDGRLIVGMVGYPNVGKSSIINALCGKKRVSVAPTPGKTRHFQTLPIDNNITLCDCPGLVFPSVATTKADMVCDGILSIDHLRDCFPPIALIAKRIPRRVFELTYGLKFPPDSPDHVSAQALLEAYARNRSFFSHKGIPNLPQAARYILKDYVKGKLLYIHPPPKLQNTQEEEDQQDEEVLEVEDDEEEYFTDSEEDDDDQMFNVMNVNEQFLIQKEEQLKQHQKKLRKKQVQKEEEYDKELERAREHRRGVLKKQANKIAEGKTKQSNRNQKKKYRLQNLKKEMPKLSPMPISQVKELMEKKIQQVQESSNIKTE